MLLVLIHKRDSFLYTSRPENLHVWVIYSLTTLWGGISHKDLCQNSTLVKKNLHEWTMSQKQEILLTFF